MSAGSGIVTPQSKLALAHLGDFEPIHIPYKRDVDFPDHGDANAVGNNDNGFCRIRGEFEAGSRATGRPDERNRSGGEA